MKGEEVDEVKEWEKKGREEGWQIRLRLVDDEGKLPGTSLKANLSGQACPLQLKALTYKWERGPRSTPNDAT